MPVPAAKPLETADSAAGARPHAQFPRGLAAEDGNSFGAVDPAVR
jgi:hypothetical protein